MYTKDIENIDKQIEELYAKRAEIENAIEQKKREAEKKKAEAKEKEFNSIKNAITAFNQKYNENWFMAKDFKVNKNNNTNNNTENLWDLFFLR